VEGMGMVLGAMEMFKLSPKVQRQACWTLLTLSGTDEFSRLVANGGGGTAVINAMVDHRLTNICLLKPFMSTYYPKLLFLF
jgi:hypothetical protein